MNLTGREIKDLAEYAGFYIEDHAENKNLMDDKFSINKCPESGVRDDEDGEPKHYNYIVACDGCEGNECSPLGEPIGDCNSGHHPFDTDT